MSLTGNVGPASYFLWFPVAIFWGYMSSMSVSITQDVCFFGIHEARFLLHPAVSQGQLATPPAKTEEKPEEEKKEIELPEIAFTFVEALLFLVHQYGAKVQTVVCAYS